VTCPARVLPQIGLDGLFLLSPDTQRTLRKFPLEHVSRWARRGNMLNLYTRTPSDIEERTITLQGDDRTIGSVLDTLTSSCMQCVSDAAPVFDLFTLGVQLPHTEELAA